MAQRKVVITGLGMFSPIGIGIDNTRKALMFGQCGINFGDPGAEAGKNPWPTYRANVKGFDPEKYIADKKSIRITTRNVQLAISAAFSALEDSGLPKGVNKNEDNYNTGIIFGAGSGNGIVEFGDVILGSLNHKKQFDYQLCGKKGIRYCPPLWILPRLPNTSAGQIAILNSIKGINYSVVNGSNSGSIAIGEAYRAISSKRADIILAGGVDELLSLPLSYKCEKYDKLLDHSIRGSAPFSADRKGYIMGEGAIALILESEESALKRNAKIYAQLSGYSNLYNPHAKTSVKKEAKAYSRSLKDLLQKTDVLTKDISAINSSGVGLPIQDAAESIAIKNVFQDKAYSIPVIANKSQTGHLGAASGAFEAAVSALYLKYGFISPTIRRKEGDPDCDLNYVKEALENQLLTNIISSSYDITGSMCNLLLNVINLSI